MKSAWLKIIVLLLITGVLSPATNTYAEEIDESLIASSSEEPDIWEFKDNYAPNVYSPESIIWQYFDVAALAILLLTGAILVLKRKSSIWLTSHIALSLLYLGLFRGACICPVGATVNFSMALVHTELIGRITLMIFIMPLIMALLFGRIFCGAVCPLGAIQQLFARKKPVMIPAKLNLILTFTIPPLFLLSTVYLAISKGIFLACRFDPFKPLFMQGHLISQKILSIFSTQYTEPEILFACDITAWLILVAVLIAGFFITRPFCRFLCPYSVLLGILSLFSFKQLVIKKNKCTRCKMCLNRCPVQAINFNRKNKEIKINQYMCIKCGCCLGTCRNDAIIHQ